MPRFYFHVPDGKAQIDHEGTDLPSLEEAEREAVRTAGEIIREGSVIGESWTMAIVDEKSNVLRMLNFSKESKPISR